MSEDGRISIEMTGKDDGEDFWKIALAGFAGAGKTMFASTAPDPLFVFFTENPRIKSVRSRYVPHVKLTNQVNQEGSLVMTVQDKLQVLVDYLRLDGGKFKTLVIDTGDELFQAMKEGRRIKQGGEFAIGDWSWIGDAYREVITGLIDLPMNLLVLFHVKNTSDGEDGIMRELMLQGLPKDEAPSWFDVVGVIDTYEVVNEEGDNETRRTILTQPNRVYPWLKDHSGNLPRRFEISRSFEGDFERFVALLTGEGSEDVPEEQKHQVLAEISAPTGEKKRPSRSVPTPQQLQEKKAERAKKLTETIMEVAAEAAERKEALAGSQEQEEKASPETISEPEPDEAAADKTSGQELKGSEDAVLKNELPDLPDSSSEVEETSGEEVSDEEKAVEEKAVELVETELGGVEVTPNGCAVCGEPVDDEDLRALTEIRFRKILCRTHFREALEAR